MHFFFEVPSFTATAVELDEEVDDEDVLELELEESESEASEAPELLSTSASSMLSILHIHSSNVGIHKCYEPIFDWRSSFHGADHRPGCTKRRNLTSNVVHLCLIIQPQPSNNAPQYFPSHQHMGGMVQCTPWNHRILRLYMVGLLIPSPSHQPYAMRPSHVCGIVVDMPGVDGLRL